MKHFLNKLLKFCRKIYNMNLATAVKGSEHPSEVSARKACLNNAKNLIRSSKAVSKIGLYNIAYHLAALSLEEIGKAGLIAISEIAIKSEDSGWLQRKMQDHVAKLFWAFFGAQFGKKVITNEVLNTYKGLAQHIHNQRLRGLYVDVNGTEVLDPSAIIAPDEWRNLINLAESRLLMEKTVESDQPNEQDSLLFHWFLKTTEDSEKRKFIMSKVSMEKLVELGTVILWISWIKNRFEKIEEENRELLERELNRPPPNGDECYENKWKLKIRLYSDSHSIRQKALNKWNEMSGWIKLNSVSGGSHSNEILVEFILPKAVKVTNLWEQTRVISQKFITAINIGSMGFFWWHLPRMRSRFYEKLIDLENNEELRVERKQRLKIDWGRGTLTESDLMNSALCFSSIPSPQDEKRIKPFNYYVGGLTLLGIIDINYRCEVNAYANFYHALKSAFVVYDDWNGKTPFLEALQSVFEEIGIEKSNLVQCHQIGEGLEETPGMHESVTLREVGMMKILCDGYFLRVFRKKNLEDERG